MLLYHCWQHHPLLILVKFWVSFLQDIEAQLLCNSQERQSKLTCFSWKFKRCTFCSRTVGHVLGFVCCRASKKICFLQCNYCWNPQNSHSATKLFRQPDWDTLQLCSEQCGQQYPAEVRPILTLHHSVNGELLSFNMSSALHFHLFLVLVQWKLFWSCGSVQTSPLGFTSPVFRVWAHYMHV